MKIEVVGTQGPMNPFDVDHSRKAPSTESDFSTELQEQTEGVSHEELKELLDKIDEQGAKLTKTPTYDELKEYRNLIKTFVGTIVSQMYTVNSKTGWDRFGRQKVYTTVRKIDRELENMAEKIRLGQSAQLDVVASHDAIRGMLVDLYM